MLKLCNSAVSLFVAKSKIGVLISRANTFVMLTYFYHLITTRTLYIKDALFFRGKRSSITQRTY